MDTETNDPFAKAYDEKVRPLMNKIDEARRYLSPNRDRITFPNVVVVGDQSSGKSSLLEALSLVELPKGTGIVTRCPLVLRLRNSKERKVYRLYDDNQKTLLDEENLNMSQYIEQETRKLAGNQKNIVHELIELQIEDHRVRDLTVVDLPGIAHNPVADQPSNIHEQTTNLIHQYIQPEGSLILCVFPANVDVAVAEALSLARNVDPEGKRTIGVITKTDLAPDQDMLIAQLLMNRRDVLHLKLGFIAVRNRSSDEKISLQDARNREKEFFSQHSAASAVDQKKVLGIDALINCLATLYSKRVKDTFPKMRYEIEVQLTDIREQQSKLPVELTTTAARLTAYNELVDLYVDKILKAELISSKDDECVMDQNNPYTINTYYMALVEKYQGLPEQSLNSSNRGGFKATVLGDDDDDIFVYNATSVDDQALKQILISIYSYWNMLIKRFTEYVTLSIRARCVFSVCDNIKQRLREISAKESDLIDAHLCDDYSIRKQREYLQKTKERLEKAFGILCHDEEILTNDKYIFNDFTPTDHDATNTLDALLSTLKIARDKNNQNDQKEQPSNADERSTASANMTFGTEFGTPTTTVLASTARFPFGMTTTSTTSLFGTTTASASGFPFQTPTTSTASLFTFGSTPTRTRIKKNKQ
ncbi:unnamed protein product [Rotaria sp. Silwood1]|nr:unnamed protein product [Rotaria sp. Silwood1]